MVRFLLTKTIYLNSKIFFMSPYVGDFIKLVIHGNVNFSIICTKFVRKNIKRPYVQAINMIFSSFYLILFSCSDLWKTDEHDIKSVNKLCASGFQKFVLFVDRLNTLH